MREREREGYDLGIPIPHPESSGEVWSEVSGGWGGAGRGGAGAGGYSGYETPMKLAPDILDVLLQTT